MKTSGNEYEIIEAKPVKWHGIILRSMLEGNYCEMNYQFGAKITYEPVEHEQRNPKWQPDILAEYGDVQILFDVKGLDPRRRAEWTGEPVWNQLIGASKKTKLPIILVGGEPFTENNRLCLGFVFRDGESSLFPMVDLPGVQTEAQGMAE